MVAAFLLLAVMTGDTAWKDFSVWFAKEGTPGAPADVLKAYGGKLKARGVEAEVAEARVKEVQAYIAAHPKEALTLHFDRLFTWSEAPFSREPSAFMRRVAGTRKPGMALDIAMGQGRNSVWLAQQGWTVSGYDISSEALRQAAMLAAGAGVKLETKQASHEEYELGQGQWDLIVMSYAFTKLSDEAYMKKVQESLKPGGMLLVEGFGSGRELAPNTILKAFLDYRVLVYEELPDVADWGRMKAPLLRMAVERR